MPNLFEETEEMLIENGKAWDDVVFISNMKEGYFENYHEVEIDVDTFIKVAKTIEYDDGFGGNEISIHLKIVGKNWWLERHEYDGAESWVYKEKPQRPKLKLNEAKSLLLGEDLGIKVE